ncbi:MAG: porin [Pseudomonadales bacterium]|nr:porin [Pseudomonadales bacterium]
MKIHKFPLQAAILGTIVSLSATLALAADEASDLELYMDTQTKQIFAEPGPNRVRMGTFRPVDAQPATVTAALPQQALPQQTQVPVVNLADMARRLDANEQEIEQIRSQNAAPRPASWTDTLRIRGYLQTRYTSMIGGDKDINLWSDRSVGNAQSLGNADKNFLIRRARLVFSGDAGEHLSFYVQPDLASSVGGSGNVAQIRDAYGDIYFNASREHRFRIGQSKVPFGFENLQSSSNRLAPDRNDALNSGVRDERDLGAFYYYTPELVQSRFSEIGRLGLKHTGNYGMFGLGVYNGQGANRGDRNNNLHTVARLTYPWQFANGQFFEASVQGYTGKYVPSTGNFRGLGDTAKIISGSAQNVNLIPERYQNGYNDDRIAISAIWYPQPFGLQAEWNWGNTPKLNLETDTIEQGTLDGGYVQAMYMFKNDLGTFIPFLKWQYFDGANKGETNAPANKVNDVELGIEWQVARELEISAEYHMMKRNNLVLGNRPGRIDYERFDSDALRIQLQYNY